MFSSEWLSLIQVLMLPWRMILCPAVQLENGFTSLTSGKVLKYEDISPIWGDQKSEILSEPFVSWSGISPLFCTSALHDAGFFGAHFEATVTFHRIVSPWIVRCIEYRIQVLEVFHILSWETFRYILLTKLQGNFTRTSLYGRVST